MFSRSTAVCPTVWHVQPRWLCGHFCVWIFMCVCFSVSACPYGKCVCACMVTLFFQCMCLICSVVSVASSARHLHQLQRMVLTSVMTELGPLIGQTVGERIWAPVLKTPHVYFLLSSLYSYCYLLSFLPLAFICTSFFSLSSVAIFKRSWKMTKEAKSQLKLPVINVMLLWGAFNWLWKVSI